MEILDLDLDLDVVRFSTSWYIDLVAINNCMARTAPDLLSRLEPPPSNSGRVPQRCMALPLYSHPIFNLRKATIVVDLIGVVLCILSDDRYWDQTLPTCALLLAFSALVCTVDLISYAKKKVEDPDEDPKWPSLKWIFLDLIMTAVLQFMFWGALVSLSDSYYGTSIVGAYGALTAFISS